MLVVFLILAFDSRLKIQAYTISSPKIKGDDINIVLITDLHSCKYGDNQQDLINAVKLQNPDLILLGGDIFDDLMPYNNSKILLEGISNLSPIYYVTGNHEYWSYDTPNIFSILKGYNIDVLEGASSIVNINNTSLNICGVSDPSIFHYTDTKTTTYAQLKQLSTTLDDSHFNILLSHRPELIDSYCKYNFDLVTCGHTHGGQWRVPGLINGLYSPNQGLLPKYAGGQYDLDSLTMIVSRGLARESSMIPRIFNRPELVVITLTQKE